jgi:hypothetical protein
MRHLSTNARLASWAAPVALGLCLLSLAPCERDAASHAAAPPTYSAPPTRTQANAAEIKKRLTAEDERLEAPSRHLHATPELSLQ